MRSSEEISQRLVLYLTRGFGEKLIRKYSIFFWYLPCWLSQQREMSLYIKSATALGASGIYYHNSAWADALHSCKLQLQIKWRLIMIYIIKQKTFIRWKLWVFFPLCCLTRPDSSQVEGFLKKKKAFSNTCGQTQAKFCTQKSHLACGVCFFLIKNAEQAEQSPSKFRFCRFNIADWSSF